MCGYWATLTVARSPRLGRYGFLKDWQICWSKAHLPDEQAVVLVFRRNIRVACGNFHARFHVSAEQRAKGKLRDDGW